MLQKIKSKKELFVVSISSSFVFYLLANGYRFFNPIFSGDSLLMIYQNDSAWQIALGRFVQPILVLLRGGIVSPFLISVISIFWLSLSVYFFVDFLEIKRFLSIIFIVAAMTCNSTVLAANATFLHSVDFYALALFLSVFGVWLIKEDRLICNVLGTISLSMSLGIYQSYICVAIALVMIHFLFKLMNRPTFKSFFYSAIKYLLSFLGAAGIYYVVWKVFQKIFNIWTANTYNGLASVGNYSDVSIGTVILTTYKKVLDYFMYPETFITMPFRGVSLSIFWVYTIRFCNAVVFLLLILMLVKKNIECKTSLWHRLIQILIILVFPLGINFVCIISKGMEHTLMTYAFCLAYVLAIKMAENHSLYAGELRGIRNTNILWSVVMASVMIVSWSNIVYSNQVYLKKDLQDKATYSLMTRIVYEIESTDGYVAGVTPVSFYGSFENTSYITDMEAFKDILPYGMGKSSLTYIGTDYAFLTYMLNVNMNLTRIQDHYDVIQQMPNYPAEGAVAFVDGTLVVKISD